MQYMLCKHEVSDYDVWREVFDSHAKDQAESGLSILNVLRDSADPNVVVMFFRIDDLEKAMAFTQTPEASKAADVSGVIGTPEVLYLHD